MSLCSMVQYLKSRLSSYQYVLPNQDLSFIPVKELASTLDTSALRKLSMDLGASVEDADRYANGSLSRSITTALILLAIDEEAKIFSFLDAGWTDLHLPLTSDTPATTLPSRLSSHLRENFERNQWSFLSPEFNKLGEHLDLDERTILPYLEISETIVKKGVFSDVSILCAKIHPFYQTIYHPNGVPDPKIALKRLSPEFLDLFERERTILNCLRSLNEPHIIPLLTSYKWRGDCFLMLPFAESTLEGLWKSTDPSELGPSVISWALLQIAGLADCLARLHHFPSPLVSGSPTDLDSSGPVVGALHADISPENILVMQHTTPILNSISPTTEVLPSPLGTLIFSDFGLSTLFHQNPIDENSTPFRGTRTFEAPEARSRVNIGRASDVWSLGGVVLEFLVWLVLGRKVLETFFQERCTEDAGWGGRIRSDCLYALLVDDERIIMGSEVKGVVWKYLELAREDVRCEDSVKHALDLVREGMLVVDAHQRFTAQKVAERFRVIVEEMS